MYRILIADDEKSIREGVAKYLAKHCQDFQVVAEAENGEEALRLAKELLPEVILTDIAMPKMNGLDFLEQIKYTLPDTKMIVLSGYDSFEYARAALRLGVKDYLMKPLDTDRLLEILGEFRRELDLEKRNWQQTERGGNPVFSEKKSMQEMLEEAAHFLETQEKGKLCYRVCMALGLENGSCRQEVQNRFRGTVKAACLDNGGEELFLFCYKEQESKEAFLKINLGLTAVANHCRLENKGKIHFFIGGEACGREGLKASRQQAYAAAEFGLLQEMPAVFHYEDGAAGQMSLCSCPPEELLKEIVVNAYYGSREARNVALDNLFDWFENAQTGNAHFIRSGILAVSHRILGYGKDVAVNYLEMEHFRRQIMKAGSLRDLKQELLTFILLLGEKKEGQKKEQSLSQRADKIIQENIGEPDFTLDDVAGLLFISPNYLRQVFKKETGMTFVEYLTQTRMNYARKLLDTGEVKVADAAFRAGYRDPRYFSSCFKKLFQVSPSEYAENRKTEM